MADNSKESIVQQTLISWVFRSKISLQLLLLCIILAMVFLRVLPLEIQKRIVNDVLSAGNFSLLVIYCLIYLASVVLASSLKFAMNGLQSVIGQRAMTDMRRELYTHILRLPLNFFRKTQPGTVVTSLVNELATSGNFVGMAIAVPLSNILTLLAFGVYLIWLNPLLGVITLSIYPIAVFVVPLAQRGANKANKQRVTVSQQMASQITESMIGIQEIHAHGSFRLEEGRYNILIERLLKIRIIWTLYRYGVKVINNLFVGMGPVLVFILGGYLMMQGKIELGSIVAFLSAQEKLYDPWKEIIEFYQVYQDASIRYTKIMHIFDQDTEFLLDYNKPGPLPKRGGRVEVQNLSLFTADNIKLLDQINLVVESGEHLALVGFSGSGKSTLAGCISQLFTYSTGDVLLDGHSVAALSKEEIVNSIGYISQSPFIFTGTINENLLYAHDALASFPETSKSAIKPTLDDKIIVLQETGIFVDVVRFGLNTTIDSARYPGLDTTLLRVRKSFQENFGSELAEYVEFFREDHYLHYSTVAENLIFGTARQADFAMDKLSGNPQFINFLKSCSLHLPLLETGTELLRQTVDILGDVPGEDIFFEQTPVLADSYESCLLLADMLTHTSPGELSRQEQNELLAIALRFIPSRHKIIDLQPLLKSLILSGRKSFRSWCTENAAKAVSFYTETQYLDSHSIINNIFFGTLTTDSPAVDDRVNQCIIQLLIEEDLLEKITDIGMAYDVGNMGDKLSGGQQQKLAIARVLLKHPKVLVMDEATSALDNKSQARIQKIVEQWKGTCTVISVIHRLDMLPSFDKVAVLKAGKIIEMGQPTELIANQGALHELIHGKKH
jgi:ABC-type bacteriocin/lantibiotic exporter with double-glycine peptidase domain